MPYVDGVVLLALLMMLVVFIHEGGHFSAARWAGIGVVRFKVFFGRSLYHFWVGNTQVSVGWIPLGGYVLAVDRDFMKTAKDAGYFDDLLHEIEQRPATLAFVNDRHNWVSSKSPFKQFVFAIAGIAFNLITGVAILSIGALCYGERVDQEMNIAVVAPDGPAAKAGLLAKDRILAVDGHKVHRWGEFLAAVRYLNVKDLPLTVERNGEKVELILKKEDLKEPIRGHHLMLAETGNFPLLGLDQEEPKVQYVRSSPGNAIQLAMETILFDAKSAGAYILHWAWAPSRFGVVPGYESPPNLVKQTKTLSGGGLAEVLFVFGVTSVGIGLVNLMPFWPFDGGIALEATAQGLGHSRPLRRFHLSKKRIHGAITGVMLFCLLVNMITMLLASYFKW